MYARLLSIASADLLQCLLVFIGEAEVRGNTSQPWQPTSTDAGDLCPEPRPKNTSRLALREIADILAVALTNIYSSCISHVAADALYLLKSELIDIRW